MKTKRLSLGSAKPEDETGLDGGRGARPTLEVEDVVIFTQAFLIQTAGSAVAVLILTGIAAWARLAKPMPILDEPVARRYFTEEFPAKPLDQVWISDDGRGALARSGDLALVLYAAGDGYIARHLLWDQAMAAKPDKGQVVIPFHDVAAPRGRLAFANWPLA